MSKIIKKNQSADVHMHIENAYKMINEFLPSVYVAKVAARLKEKGCDDISNSMIRNVRNRTNDRNDILLALVEVAKENKESIEKIKQLIA